MDRADRFRWQHTWEVFSSGRHAVVVQDPATFSFDRLEEIGGDIILASPEFIPAPVFWDELEFLVDHGVRMLGLQEYRLSFLSGVQEPWKTEPQRPSDELLVLFRSGAKKPIRVHKGCHTVRAALTRAGDRAFLSEGRVFDGVMKFALGCQVSGAHHPGEWVWVGDESDTRKPRGISTDVQRVIWREEMVKWEARAKTMT